MLFRIEIYSMKNSSLFDRVFTMNYIIFNNHKLLYEIYKNIFSIMFWKKFHKINNLKIIFQIYSYSFSLIEKQQNFPSTHVYWFPENRFFNVILIVIILSLTCFHHYADRALNDNYNWFNTLDTYKHASIKVRRTV